jgi:hypothetical protein
VILFGLIDGSGKDFDSDRVDNAVHVNGQYLGLPMDWLKQQAEKGNDCKPGPQAVLLEYTIFGPASAGLRHRWRLPDYRRGVSTTSGRQKAAAISQAAA